VDDPRAIRALILLARIYERQKRCGETEQLYLDILNMQTSQDAREIASEAYACPLGRWVFAPLSYFMDETAFVLKLLQDWSAGIANDKRRKICAHYLLSKLYATCPKAELRNATKAVEHGTSACELSGWAEPICLDVLAAAYAEAGRFDLAVQRQKEAIVRLSAGRTVMRTAFVNRLTMYENGIAESPKGLVARWEFEQNKDGMVSDTSGNNLHGRLVGDAKVYADPDRGNVLRLDGDGDWVDCGTDRRFDITDEITISAWVKVSKFDKGWQAIVTKGAGPTIWWGLRRTVATDTLQFYWGGDRIPGIELYGNLLPHENVNDDKWHHVTAVFDGRQTAVYVDGELDAISPILAFSRINAPTSPVLIGTSVGLPREWNGLIDDVRIYSQALSPDEITQLYHDTK
jgi:hypothetical protein